MNVLFLSQRGHQCGVGDYGERLYDILKRSKTINFIYSDTMDLDNIDIVLYNYHSATLPHITDAFLQDKRHVKHIALYHESNIAFTPDKIIHIPNLPRPIDYNSDFEQPNNEIITIGSFGFGFPNKNFPRIAQLVREQFDVAKIRLNIPYATYGDSNGQLAMNEVQKVINILGSSNIELEVNNNYLDKNGVVEFLRKNDINLFLFDEMNGRGLSSSIDYALECNRPIGISNSYMFRHLKNVSSTIFVDEIGINEIVKKGVEPLLPIREYHNSDNLLSVIENELLTLQ
jgi:hypothetical protein